MAKLEVIVDSYEQRLPTEVPVEQLRNAPTKEYGRGDAIEPVDDAERERLISEGIAAEPGAAERQEAERLQAEADRLKAEADAAAERADAAEERAENPELTEPGADDLDAINQKQPLLDIATAEGVPEVSERDKVAELKDKIRAHREGAPG